MTYVELLHNINLLKQQIVRREKKAAKLERDAWHERVDIKEKTYELNRLTHELEAMEKATGREEAQG